MRILPVLVPLLALLTTVFAEDSDLAQKMAAVGDSSRQIALENLLSERGSEQTLTAVIAAAKKNGVSEQAIRELLTGTDKAGPPALPRQTIRAVK